MSEADTPKNGESARDERTWSTLHLWQMQPVRDVLLGLGILALFWLGQATSVVTVPLLLAILLAYLFEPVIVWMMGRFSLSRRVSVISIIASSVLFVIIPIALGGAYAVGQLVTFALDTADNVQGVKTALDGYTADEGRAYLAERDVPDAWVWVHDEIREASDDPTSSMGNVLNAAVDYVTTNSERVAETAAGVSIEMVNRVLGAIGAVFGVSFMLFITGFFFFFLSTEWVRFKGFARNLLPEKNEDRIVDLLTKFDAVISGFIRGRVTIAFIQAVVFSIGYFLIGVPGAFILGPLVAVLSVVPYLALIGLPISVSLLALQSFPDGSFRGEWWWILGAPTALYFLGQALDDYVWTPVIQGKSTGMDTPTILFASLAGGALFGVFGLLIAIPIAACVKIIIQEILWPEFKEWAEGRAEDPLPLER